MHCLTLQQITGQGDTHTALPTRPHRWQIVGQGDTHTQPCLQDRTDGRSPVRETHTHTQPCLQDRTDGRSPVRETHTHTHTHTALPTRPHRWQVAGQGDTHTHTHTALPTRPHRWQVAGQGDTHTQPCLQDRTDGRSPVRETHTHSPAYKTAQMAARRKGHTLLNN